MAAGIDHLDSRQLLSTIIEPDHGPVLVHHHQAVRAHHAAIVARAHAVHHRAAMPLTARDATSSLQVVAQFNNVNFTATKAIADSDIWAVGWTSPNGTDEPVAVHFNPEN